MSLLLQKMVVVVVSHSITKHQHFVEQNKVIYHSLYSIFVFKSIYFARIAVLKRDL